MNECYQENLSKKILNPLGKFHSKSTVVVNCFKGRIKLSFVKNNFSVVFFLLFFYLFMFLPVKLVKSFTAITEFSKQMTQINNESKKEINYLCM